ncbi:uncharacterized protein O3C94_014286 [Discoglossus pictus]
MNYILSVVFVLAALLEASNGLNCVECQDSSFECSGPSVSCTGISAVCASQFTQSTDGTMSVKRMCAETVYCNQSFTVIMGSFKTKISSSCCTTDGCKPSSPSITMTGNGITCPSCYAQGSSTCSEVNDIQCTGNETKCYTYTSSSGLISDQIFARGCATEQLCSGTVGTIVPSNMQGGNVQCTKGCTGSCLRCVHCQGSSTQCSGSLSSCTESNAVCASRFIQSSDGSVSVERGCAVPTYCSQSLTVLKANIKSNISSSCCTTEGCTPTTPTMNGNGLKCPSCYAEGSSQCSQVNDIECTGNEAKCFTYSLSAGSISSWLFMKGCTTEQLCSGTTGTIVPPALQGGNAQCTSSTPVCGNCLRCMTCQSTNGLDCSGSFTICDSNEVCASTFTQSTDGTMTVVRGCASPTFCDQSFTLLNGNTKVKISSSCCNTEGCKPITPNMVGNGLHCSSCYAEGSTKCSQTTTIECTGNEKKCYSYSLSSGFSANQIYVQGCTSERLCSGTINSIVPTALQGGMIQCTNDTPSSSVYATKITTIFVLALTMLNAFF